MYCISVFIISIVGGGISNGIILQRFPEKDWPDTPFIEGIEWVRFLIIDLSLPFIYITLLSSFVNHKDGLCLRNDKNHNFLYRY